MTRVRMAIRRLTIAREDQRGSISLWAALGAAVMIILAGLTVDVAGQVHTRQHAADIAAQAARAGGQQLQLDLAVRGEPVHTDPAQAVAAARRYLAAAHIAGTVSLQGGTVVVVTTTASYSTVFLGLIGIDRLDASATATSRTVRALNGQER